MVYDFPEFDDAVPQHATEAADYPDDYNCGGVYNAVAKPDIERYEEREGPIPPEERSILEGTVYSSNDPN